MAPLDPGLPSALPATVAPLLPAVPPWLASFAPLAAAAPEAAAVDDAAPSPLALALADAEDADDAEDDAEEEEEDALGAEGVLCAGVGVLLEEDGILLGGVGGRDVADDWQPANRALLIAMTSSEYFKVHV
ncbi:MAG: hypothetical protein LBF16_05605 [Pseudomonadales bacterium]|jgi:hypothetical protein|nr:hypothetical protein [Pseudomonadales bacterium]